MGYKDFNIPQVGPQTPPVANPNKPDPTQEIIDRVVKAKEQIAIIDALGGIVAPQKPPDAPSERSNNELTAVGIITKSLDVLEKQNERVQDAIAKRDEEIAKARIEADKAKTEVLQVTAGQIGGAMERLEKIRDEMRAGGRKSLLEELEDHKKIGAILTPQAPPITSQPSENISLALEKMKEDHDIAMKKLDVQLIAMNNEMKIKLTEMTDNKLWKEREWEENKTTKQNAMSQLSDIAASIAATFQAKAAGIGSQPAVQPAAAKQNEEVSAVIRVFPCQRCGADVAIPPDASEVTCATPGCGVVYTVNRPQTKEGIGEPTSKPTKQWA